MMELVLSSPCPCHFTDEETDASLKLGNSPGVTGSKQLSAACQGHTLNLHSTALMVALLDSADDQGVWNLQKPEICSLIQL